MQTSTSWEVGGRLQLKLPEKGKGRTHAPLTFSPAPFWETVINHIYFSKAFCPESNDNFWQQAHFEQNIPTNSSKDIQSLEIPLPSAQLVTNWSLLQIKPARPELRDRRTDPSVLYCAIWLRWTMQGRKTLPGGWKGRGKTNPCRVQEEGTGDYLRRQFRIINIHVFK